MEYIRRYTPIQQKYCIIFGAALQENESSLAVIFVPIFTYHTKGR